jgi:hypothetical protein
MSPAELGKRGWDIFLTIFVEGFRKRKEPPLEDERKLRAFRA